MFHTPLLAYVIFSYCSSGNSLRQKGNTVSGRDGSFSWLVHKLGYHGDVHNVCAESVVKNCDKNFFMMIRHIPALLENRSFIVAQTKLRLVLAGREAHSL